MTSRRTPTVRTLERREPIFTAPRSRYLAITAIVAVLAACNSEPSDDAALKPVAIGDRLEIFVDRYLVDSMPGLGLRLHAPVLMQSARPPSDGHYATIISDQGLFRLYNRGGFSEYDGSPGEHTEYFESVDGVNWTRPSLGLFAVDGSRENNVVLANAAPFSHNFSPFLDTRPGVAPERRYKALAGTVESGLVPFVSSDGLHWEQLQDEPVITDGMFDSQNVSFWSETEGRYVCYFRTWTGDGYTGLRTISRSTSPDFLRWSPAVAMNPNAEGEHLYTSGTHPYFRAPHIYIALATRFQPERGNATDILLMTSRGGDTFDRTFMDAFIRPGLDSTHWENRANYAAVGVIPTGPSEMSVYVRGRRYAMRTDGFASVHADYSGGVLTTVPLLFDGTRLELNVSTSASGRVVVEILDPIGVPVKGFATRDADPIVGDAIAHTVTWNGSPDIGALAGRPIRLRLSMQDADLYSLRFTQQ